MHGKYRESRLSVLDIYMRSSAIGFPQGTMLERKSFRADRLTTAHPSERSLRDQASFIKCGSPSASIHRLQTTRNRPSGHRNSRRIERTYRSSNSKVRRRVQPAALQTCARRVSPTRGVFGGLGPTAASFISHTLVPNPACGFVDSKLGLVAVL